MLTDDSIGVRNLAANEIRQKVNAEFFVSITKCQNFQHYQMLALTFPALTFWRKRYRSSSISIGWRFLVVCQNIVTRSKFVKFVRFSKLALRTEPLAAFAPFSSLFPSSAANSPTTCLPRHANPTCQPANPSTRQPVNP